jgi:hypothetical protein
MDDETFIPDNKIEGDVYRAESGAIRSNDVHLRYDLIPVPAFRRLTKRYTDGAVKYGEHNWQKGFKWSVVFNHMMEHMMKFQNGEFPEDDHLAAIAWGAFALMIYQSTHPELNDLQPDGAIHPARINEQ